MEINLEMAYSEFFWSYLASLWVAIALFANALDSENDVVAVFVKHQCEEQKKL